MVEKDPPSEKDMQKTFEEEIKKPYYNIFYLDNFKLQYEKLDVSIVIPTYNRCPYKPGTLKENNNPLVWGIKTALMQKPNVKEIIIADDNSQDNTEEIVRKYQDYSEKNKLPKIIYIKHRKRKGISAIRNLGSKQASGRYILFIDDDCFVTPYMALGAIYTFEELEKKGVKIGAVNLPTYNRSSVPSGYLGKKEIGVLDFVKGIYKSNKDFFPAEYLNPEMNGAKFLNPELQILSPFSILNLNTTALVSRKAFEEVGGFREKLLRRMEDREFGASLVENGYSIYFSPDPKFHCVHGSYGLKTGRMFEGEDWFKKLDKSISLKKAMEICDDPKEDTGARIDPKDYIYESILTFFFLAYERNRRGAIKWIQKVYEEFVRDGKTGLFGNDKIPTPGESERKKIWFDAINEGLELIKQEERDNIKNINKTIREMQKEKKMNDNIINILGNL
ncbi:MAG: glycosyltransferase [Nanoarchaeota archaeon]|nr:glycosyltransferase [Nanoarchaeota archaeon]